MKKEKMDIVFLLDRSGSMAGIEKDTIGGYNAYIKKQRKNNVLVSTILFDDRYEILNDRVDIKEVNDLTSKDYFVRGSTALYDAIGNTIKHMDKVKKGKVLFIITTDGYENASRNYNKEQIKELIEGHKDYEFIYIGANIDSYAEGSSIGIKKSNISNYVQDEKGVGILYNAISKATECCLNNVQMDYSWKKELEDYIDETKETL